jgi:ABC-type Mn2+/Zn2+ transport system permease subunit
MMHWFDILVPSVSLALACAMLSVIVVLRRWAFIGEGIGHSGLGGAGTAWILMLLIPALDQPWLPYLVIVIFCLLTALAMGAISRGRGIQSDAAIGIFMVASLAWGFLARQIFLEMRHQEPAFWEAALFGQLVPFSTQFALAASGICLAVVVVVIGLWKEIIAYAFDPLLAETAGIRAGAIHYLLMLLVALVIVIGVRVAGSVLVTALLVLPGATALLLTRKLTSVLTCSVLIALSGTIGGVLLNSAYRQLPAGPSMVLIMFIEFLLAFMAVRLPMRSASST